MNTRLSNVRWHRSLLVGLMIPTIFATGCWKRGKGGTGIYANPYSFTTLAGRTGMRTVSVGGSIAYADGFGSAAQFGQMSGVAADKAGNIYVADLGPGAIRKITPAGEVTTIARTGGKSLRGVAVDQAGNVYAAHWDGLIEKITPDGLVSSLAGTTTATGAPKFSRAMGVAVDQAGNVYVAENETIQIITPEGAVSTLAGKEGTAGYVDGPGSVARFSVPVGVAVDAGGNVYVAEEANHTVRKITPAGMVTTIAGRAGVDGYVDGPADRALFHDLLGVAVDGERNVYVVDFSQNTVRRISPDGMVTTLAGNMEKHGNNDGVGQAAEFTNPWGVAADSAGNLYMAESQKIRKGTPFARLGEKRAEKIQQTVVGALLLLMAAVIFVVVRHDRRKATLVR